MYMANLTIKKENKKRRRRNDIVLLVLKKEINHKLKIESNLVNQNKKSQTQRTSMKHS